MAKKPQGTQKTKRNPPTKPKKPVSRRKPDSTALAARQAPDQPAPQQAEPAQAAGPGFSVVGVGASAGGLQAFSQLLRALPTGSNLAIVYVQHLAPKYESTLAELLRQTTMMPVAPPSPTACRSSSATCT